MGLIYEVAQTGMAGTVEQVQKMNMWSFFDVVGYLRSQAEFRRLLNE